MNDPLQFVADSASASELALAILLQSLAEHHPEVIETFRKQVTIRLMADKHLSPGAKENLLGLYRSLP